MKHLSIIVPCYNEAQTIPLFYQETIKYLIKIEKDYHITSTIIFIDDGSKDQTLMAIQALQQQDERIEFLSFSRNFGKEAGIFAGLQYASGDYVVIMDADLQDPPELLEEMLLGITSEGYDCVATRRSTRKGEPIVRSFFAHCFYRLLNKMSKVQIVDGARDYRMMTRQMVDAILSVGEYNRFSKGIFSWVGYNTKWLEYQNIERVAGQTKWSFWKLFLYSLDGIVAYTTLPLSLASFFGFTLCFIAAVMIIFFIIKTIMWGDPVAGYPSLVCFILFIGGIQLFCIGILGQYLSKTYLETKERPLYLIKESSSGLIQRKK